MKTLGIIGGLGPLATARFYEKIVRLTPAKEDQDHFDTLIFSRASIPKRVEYILGESEDSPLPALIDTAKRLEAAGAQVLIMPCITAHYFYEDISNAIETEILDAAALTISELKKRSLHKVCLLGTRATIGSGFLEKRLRAGGIEAVSPAPSLQTEIDHLIFDCIKQNIMPEKESYEKVLIKGLELSDINLICCTELSILQDEWGLEGALDMMDVLARKTIEACMGNSSDRSFGEAAL